MHVADAFATAKSYMLVFVVGYKSKWHMVNHKGIVMMPRKKLPIGVDNFKEIVDGNYYFIDKTLMIKEIIDRQSKVFLLPRPRRFGKSLNMQMLQCFFEKPVARIYNPEGASLSYLFQDKLVWQHEALRELQGKYPVIFLTFKDVKPRTWQECYEKLIDAIISEYSAHRYLLQSDALRDDEKNFYQSILTKKASKNDVESSLKRLSEYLQRHYKANVIILIDEYDAPIHAGYLNNFYNDVADFIRNFFGAALKGNDALAFSVITGILRAAKEGIFSGLNNLAVYSILDEPFADQFGFTQQEVEKFLADYEMSDQLPIVREWYNGYTTCKRDSSAQLVALYNPWSLLNFIDRDGKTGAYWVNTSDNGLIKKQLLHAGSAVQKELELLLTDRVCVERRVSEGLILPGIESNEAAIWSLWIFGGYLTATHIEVDGFYYRCSLKIPNREIKQLYQELLRDIVTAVPGIHFDEVLEALVAGDVELFQELFTRFFVNIASFYDIPVDEAERSYHLFILGMLTPLSKRYHIRSNRESGHGRYDIMLEPYNKELQGIIIEFKKISLVKKELLDVVADHALNQIKEKNYAAELRARGIKNILAYGIAVDGKQVLLKAEFL